MSTSGFLLTLAFINFVSANSTEKINIASLILDYVSTKDNYYKICCPTGNPTLIDSKIAVITNSNSTKRLNISASFTSYSNFPNWYTKIFNECKGKYEGYYVKSEIPWINDLKVSSNSPNYNKLIKGFDYNDIYFSFFGFCKESVTYDDVSNKHFNMLYVIEHDVKIKTFNGKKMVIHNAVIRGSQFCEEGRPHDITSVLKPLCDGKVECDVAKSLLNVNLCPEHNHKRVLLVNMSLTH